MSLFNFNKKKVIETPIEKKETQSIQIVSLDLTQSDFPKIKESKNKDWVLYGEDNNYPETLVDLFNSSAIHQSIVNQKSTMMVGGGYTVDKTRLSDDNTVQLEKMLEFFNNNEDNLQTFLDSISFDWTLFGAIAIEVIWNKGFTKIVRYKRVSPKDIRLGKKVNGKVEKYFFSKDWSNRRVEPTPISAFDISNKTEYTQLMYFKKYNPQNEYYGVPDYVGSINYINADSKIGLFHNTSIDNGFNPSLSIHFKKIPNSEEEKEVIISQLKKQYSGAKNAGKPMVFFSDGGELKTDLDAIPVNDLDKRYTVIHEQIITNICSGHRVTSTELFGIATPGRLGNSDIDKAYTIFEKTVINPERNKIEKIINDLFYYGGLQDIKITLLEMDILSKTKDEESDSEVLTDSQITSLVNIITKANTGEITKESAVEIIILSFPSITREKAIAMLQ
jgi:capsid portal protein